MPPAYTGRSAPRTLALIFGLLSSISLIGSLILGVTTSHQGRRNLLCDRYAFLAEGSLFVLAFIGIASALAVQARDTKIAREEARRGAVADLLKMAMDDPDLDDAWGPVPDGQDHRARRRLMYINMIVSEWQMSFETKALPETRLRAISREMFSGRPGRAYWQEARQVRTSTSENKRARRFHQILDEEYQRAPAPPPEQPRPRRRAWPFVAGAAAGTLALTPILHRSLRRRTRT